MVSLSYVITLAAPIPEIIEPEQSKPAQNAAPKTGETITKSTLFNKYYIIIENIITI